MFDPQLLRVITGVIILLLIVLLPVRQGTGSKRAYLGLLIGVASVIGLCSLVLHLGHFVLVNSGEDEIKGQVERMQGDQATHIPKNLIIIDGSSETELGLDYEAVQEELRRDGYDVTVVQFAGAGATHVERYALLESFAEEIRERGLALSPNTRLMLEVVQDYDLIPTRFFKEIQHTTRGYHAATFGNLAYTMQSMRILDVAFDQNTLDDLFGLFQNVLISKLDIGLIPQMQLYDTLVDYPSFIPNPGHNRLFKFTPYDADQYVKGPQEDFKPEWASFTEYRTKRIERLFGGGITESDYFSVPNDANLPAGSYAHAFCRWRGRAPCIDGTDPAIYGRLGALDYYWNRDHLTTAGAKIYSEYFAQQLIAQHVVIK